MPITKDFKTIDEQISILKSRGLKIGNEQKAKNILKKYNYFDVINGFESFFLETASPKTYKNTLFTDFYYAFRFDSLLKKETLHCIFDFESRLRTSISYHFAENYCNVSSRTLEYLNTANYIRPSTTNTHLTNVFNHFELFRTTSYNYDGTVRNLSFIDELKRSKPYVRAYTNPPFWVVIKSLSLGSLAYLYSFLPTNVKSLVLQDFDLDIGDDNAFTQAIFILKEMRNECAHLELITIFELKPDPNLNFFNDIKSKISSRRRTIGYINVLKILKLFCSIKSIKKCISHYYRNMVIRGRRKIALKSLSKMGTKNYSIWKRI